MGFLLAACLVFAQDLSITHGPMTSAVDAHSANVWARASAPGEFKLSLMTANRLTSIGMQARAENDLTLHWHVDGLEPASEYKFEIRSATSAVIGSGTLRTLGDDLEHASFAFGSCASDKAFAKQPVWNLIRKSGADAVVLIGDTPYIDSTKLDVQRERYRAFFDMSEVRETMRAMPFYCTWDDHDFGTNDCDGRIAGKEGSRQAFLEYHCNPSYGENDRGVYTSFRRGPIEVFLLDTRWFSKTEDSAFASGKLTLLGAQQWAWLEKKLVESTAPFKIVACGMIWNDAVRPGKPDYWGAYPWERDHFFRFLSEKRIEGVVLVGGDIHRSRVVRHATREIVGYEITELITSPMAQSVIEAADALDPGLVWDAGVGQSCLIVSADTKNKPATLEAKFLQAVNASDPEVIFSTRISADHLKRKDDMSSASARPTGFLFDTIRVKERDYRYAVYVPRDWTSAKRWPGLVFLHGAGECGTDGSLQLAVGLPLAIERKPDEWPFVCVFPQKPTALEEWEQHDEAVLAILDRAIERYAVDRDRVVLTGLSQGGHGTWQIGRLHPDRFVAFAPICGYPDSPARGWKNFDPKRDWTEESHAKAALEIADALAKKPIWVFHGTADESVPFHLSEIMMDALQAKGSNAKLTSFAGVGHNCWDRAYRDEKLGAWLLDQARGAR
jgi:alkaline phosphatase D